MLSLLADDLIHLVLAVFWRHHIFQPKVKEDGFLLQSDGDIDDLRNRSESATLGLPSPPWLSAMAERYCADSPKGSNTVGVFSTSAMSVFMFSNVNLW